MFTAPSFNLLYNLWRGAFTSSTIGPFSPPAGAPDIGDGVCQLYVANRLSTDQSAAATYFGGSINVDPVFYVPPVELRVPAGTDLRWIGIQQEGSAVLDVVEVPSGSLRWYVVAYVEDRHKGFPNEYRVALLIQMDYTGGFPIP